MIELAAIATQDLAAELQRRGAMPRCTCGKWATYLGAYDSDGLTIRCHGCLRAIARCSCR